MVSMFDPVILGDIQLANRIVMAPMTRSRAGKGDVPGPVTAEYYRQRAGAGLIVAEGTQPSAAGKGYCRTPGIYSDAQVAGWSEVARQVHDAGGKIVVQLMHCGRVASRINKADDSEIVAPSAITAKGEIFTDVSGLVPMDTPRALALDEIPSVIDEYAAAASNAIHAGLDGVELHCASGYLPMQFLSSGSNRRSDGYGGPAQNRIRFVVEAVEAMAAAIGAGRIGLRICPGFPFNDVHDDDPVETYTTLLKALSPLGLAYLHLIHLPIPQIDSLAVVKASWTGSLILNNELDGERADRLLADGVADAVSFGRSFIGNPDLVARLKSRKPLAAFDPATLYTPGTKGYTDYPPFSEAAHVA